MKTILITRHAKSSWKDASLKDEERPLLEKGKKRTRKVINFLHERDVTVDCIISSHALRAVETARIFAHALRYPLDEILIDPHVYTSDGDGLTDRLFDLPDRCERVMIVGHNPAMTDFANRFLDKPIENLPTSGIISITFKTERWEEVPLAERKTDFVFFPRQASSND
jgi:phosphohistidine phosphatase